jgi:hypothetical protein
MYWYVQDTWTIYGIMLEWDKVNDITGKYKDDSEKHDV